MNSNLKNSLLYISLFIINNLIVRHYEFYKENIIYIFHIISVFVLIKSYSFWVKYNHEKRGVDSFSADEQTVVFASFFIFIVFIKLFVFRHILF